MSQLTVSREKIYRTIRAAPPARVSGRVTQLVGLVLEAEGIVAGVGEICTVELGRGEAPVLAEVIGFARGRVLLMPFHRTAGVRAGVLVTPTGRALRVSVGEGLLGRVLDGLGAPIDGAGVLATKRRRLTAAPPPDPLRRALIDEVLVTGVRVIDACVTCGRGQRLGIFSGSGVGKSTLLGMICRNASADVNVIAMIGERGREVREFVEGILGPAGLAKSVVVVVTSDETPLMRIRGAETAMTIAEQFRDQGKHVVFIMDSVTRYAMALREVGISAGEVPASRGYTPSVFARMPLLLERAGTAERGSITGFFSVLVEGDDVRNDPVTDAIRAILDGHVMLSRALANSNIYPAVDVLQSVSRLAPALLAAGERARLARLLDLYAAYTDAADLISIGAYAKGSSEKVDEAIARIDAIRAFIRQGTEESYTWDETQAALAAVTGVS
jgi:FliI/YscN family ATPase